MLLVLLTGCMTYLILRRRRRLKARTGYDDTSAEVNTTVLATALRDTIPLSTENTTHTRTTDDKDDTQVMTAEELQATENMSTDIFTAVASG